MNNELILPRGTRDLLAQEKILKDEVAAVIKETMEEFGFDPIETPALEMQSLFEAKFEGQDSDILQETYKLTDRGGRKLVLRPENTPPLARVVASYKELSRPFKRYVIGPVWRDGPIKLGRFREFWQCDIDTVGPKAGAADAEIIALVVMVFKKLGINVVTRVNNRKILNALMEKAAIPEKMRNSVIISIDKLNKIGWAGVKSELRKKNLPQESIDELETLFAIPVSKENIDILTKTVDSKLMKEGVDELKLIFDLLKEIGLDTDIKFELTMARGLAYYTGPIFEFFAKDSKMTSSIAGGGRWDNMIGKFYKKETIVPAVGIAIGLDAIITALNPEKTKLAKRTVTKVLIIPLKTEKECFKIATKLRDAGVNTEIDLMDRSLRGNLDYANGQQIPFVLIVGEKELKNNTVTLKDMNKKEQKEVKIEELTSFLT